MDVEPIARWIGTSAFSTVLRHNAGWLWPTWESLHFIGLTLLIGVAGFFDLRLMGFMKRVPLSSAFEFMPWAIGGFAINLVTGLLFIIAEPRQYFVNPTMWGKMFFLIVAGVNAMLFQWTMGDKIRQMGAVEQTPMSFKIIGAVSLIAWFGVLYCGRMLPFLTPNVQSGL